MGHTRCVLSKSPWTVKYSMINMNQVFRGALEFILCTLLLPWYFWWDNTPYLYEYFPQLGAHCLPRKPVTCIIVHSLKKFVFILSWIQWTTTFNVLEYYRILLIFQYTWAYWKHPFFEFSHKETPHETKMSLVSFISTVALISKEDL